MLLLLLTKLLEDGNVLYRKSRVKEAQQRYHYALKKLAARADAPGTPTTTPTATPASAPGLPAAAAAAPTTPTTPPAHAATALEDAAAFDDLQLHFLLNLSRCKRRLNEPEAAVELATRALALRPAAHEALYARARAHRHAHRPRQARDDLRRALALQPASRELRRMLDQVEAQCKEEDHEVDRDKLQGATAVEGDMKDGGSMSGLDRRDSIPEETPL